MNLSKITFETCEADNTWKYEFVCFHDTTIGCYGGGAFPLALLYYRPVFGRSLRKNDFHIMHRHYFRWLLGGDAQSLFFAEWIMYVVVCIVWRECESFFCFIVQLMMGRGLCLCVRVRVDWLRCCSREKICKTSVFFLLCFWDERLQHSMRTVFVLRFCLFSFY